MAEGFNVIKGRQSVLNISGNTLIKGGSGRVANIVVTTGGSGAGTASDTLSTPAASNLIFSIPTTAGVYVVDFPFSTGLYISPGSGQVINVSFD